MTNRFRPLLLVLLNFASIVWFSPHRGYSQEFEAGNKIIVSVRAAISSDSDGVLSYRYVLHSSSESKQGVWWFEVVFRAPNDSVLTTSSPSGWAPGIARPYKGYSFVDWSTEDTTGIHPGDSLTGLGYSTRMFPLITDYYAEGWHQIPSFPEGMAEDSIPGYTDQTPYGPGVVGRTIGFGIFSRQRDPLGFADTIASFVREAVSLGWLSDRNLESNIMRYLDGIRSAIQEGDSDLGISSVHRILTLLRQAPSSALTSEAYGLIFYNIRSLGETIATLKK